MLYTEIQPQSFLGSGEDFQVFLPYIGMAAILLNGTEAFKVIVNILLTEGPMWNLVKIAQAISGKIFKNNTILYMYIAQGQGQITFVSQCSEDSSSDLGKNKKLNA